jgi:RimJ/RimL family protein N-acetyltransferase
MYSIVLRTSSEASETWVIGIIGLSYDGGLVFMIHRDHWGQKYASEAFTAFLPQFFEVQPMRDDLACAIYADNAAGRRVLEKSGFYSDDARQEREQEQRLSVKEDAELRRSVCDLCSEIGYSMEDVQTARRQPRSTARIRHRLVYRVDAPLI